MFEAGDVGLAIALVDLVVTILRARAGRCLAFLIVLGLLQGVDLGGHRRSELDVSIDAEQLHALQQRRRHVDTVGDTLGVVQIGRAVVHDQIGGGHGLADRALTQRAVVDFLEHHTAEAELQQHAIGVGIVFARHLGQVVVEILLECLGQLVVCRVAVVVVVADLDRAVGRQELAAGIGLKAQAGLEQQRMTATARTFYGAAGITRRRRHALQREAQKLDALGLLLDPVIAATLIVGNTAHQLFGERIQVAVVHLLGDVLVPALGRVRNGLLERLAVDRERDRTVGMFDLDDVPGTV